MIPVSPNRIVELLVKNSDKVLSEASRKYSINGFAYVFEVGQPKPVFLFALNTRSNGPVHPSTGEWDFPAGGFEGSRLSEDWADCYRELDDYMTADENSESRLREVQTVLCDAMKKTRANWLTKLEGCVFTVNECNDTDESIRQIFREINQVQI